MKTKWILLGSVTALIASGWLATQASPKKARESELFMRQKLGYSQKAFEGIALENYSLVTTNATRLWLMTRSNIWAELKTPEYMAKSDHYQLDVLAMIDAARASNTPALLDSYRKVTADCVDCHQSFRHEQEVRQPLKSQKP